MKTLLLILMSTFLCVNALGQDYLIDLEKQPISLPDRNFYVSRVIDARPVKSAIGQVQRGMTNGKANVHFRSGLEKEIQACLNHNLPPRNDLKPVILKVLKLKIYERTQLSAESATAELVVQFFTPRGEMYVPVGKAAAVVQRKGIDVTILHNDNIAAALQKCFRQLLESDWNKDLNDLPAVTLTDLNAPADIIAEEENYPVLKAASMTKGIYMTYKEFAQNHPSVTSGFTITSKPRHGKEWRGSTEVYPVYENSDATPRTVKKVWGFSDGTTAYIFFRNSYFPLEIVENAVTFYGYSGPDQGAIVAGSVAGGLAGGLIASTASSKVKTRYVVDLLTGEPATFDVNSDEGRTVTSTMAMIIIYCRETQVAAPLRVTLKDHHDSLTTELTGFSFAELEWANLRDELTACVEGSGADCYPFLPVVNSPNYLELIPAGKNNPHAVLRPVKAQEAEFYLKKIRYAQEIEERRQGKRTN